MNESQYIQKVRQMIGDFKAADRQRKEEEAKAKDSYESECKASEAELNQMRREEENAKLSYENECRAAEAELHKRRRTFRISISIVTIILILIISIIGYSIYTNNKLKTHYAAAVEAFKMKNLGKAREEFEKVFAIKKNYKNALNLLKETYSQEFQNYSNEDRPTITVLETMEFIWIPGGCFKMGSSQYEPGHLPDEEPVHEVCVDGFWIGKTEVTNKQYRKYIPWHDSRRFDRNTMNQNDQPVAFVNWNEAKLFAKWLTQNNKEGYKFRLPTEAEWEYAARAGTTTSRFWGDDPDKACKYANVFDKTTELISLTYSAHNCDDGYAVSASVGSFLPNPFGLYDMLGNVWEWCEDVYSEDAYIKHNFINPIYRGSGSKCVIRGGGWNSFQRHIRCACRYSLEATNRGRFSTGFRLVMTK